MHTRTDYKEDYDRQYSDIELIKRFWNYLTDYKVRLTFIILIILANAGVSVLPSIMVRTAFDLLKETDTWNAIAPYAITYVGLSVIIWIFQVIQGILVSIVTQKIIKKIQMQTYKSLQEHDLSFFDKQATGKIMSRLTNDSQELNNMITIVAQFISNFIIVFTVIGVMFYYSWRL